ncbi:type 2 isopentenyl-diphosphate Delta-isomerase [Listeria sp. PSOL-1]|uniref:type 2 isopentenyl-diphosphate Delta-isomerase n=1 Tax=Listeria sp. PSOL-1 TaxID=1844999 RepID=UPI0013D8999C
MDKEDDLLRARRKDEHLALSYQQFEVDKESAFKDLDLIGTSLPSCGVDDVHLNTTFSGIEFAYPFYINAMTGGSERTKQINADFAEIAREVGVGMAVGSQSAALKNPSVRDSYEIVREKNPDGKIFANLSPAIPIDLGMEAIKMVDANLLQIHLNPAQELVMVEGDREFSNWLRRIEQYVTKLDIPVVVKEVGFGMSCETVAKLAEVGVKTVDVSGRGGTNFIQVENERRRDHAYDFLYDFGLTTPESLLDLRRLQGNNKLEILASGGIRTPLDMVKSFRLGAKSAGMAGYLFYFYKNFGKQMTIHLLEQYKEALKALFVLFDATSLDELQNAPLIVRGDLKDFCDARAVDIKQLAN